jgi:syntaxin 16
MQATCCPFVPPLSPVVVFPSFRLPPPASLPSFVCSSALLHRTTPMATRNLSQKFLALRSASRTNRAARLAAAGAAGAAGAATAGGPDAALPDEEAGLGLPQVEFSDAPPVGERPAWVPIHEQVTADLNLIREQIRALQRLHAIRLKVSFGEDVVAEQEKDIDSLTAEITSILRRCETGIKKVADVGNDGALAKQERITRINVMRSLATELNEASKQFRACQKAYLQNLRAQEVVGQQFLSGADGASRGISLDDAVDRGLTDAQMAELALIEQQSNSREKEIIRIAQSVNQLATLFRELHTLVIDQGTVLDRIDYNIATSLDKIQRGTKDLEEAEKESKKALTMKCILLLAIVCLMLLIVFIWRKSN